MTEREAIRTLHSVRVYCTPAHLAAVDYAIRLLREKERARAENGRQQAKKCSC